MKLPSGNANFSAVQAEANSIMAVMWSKGISLGFHPDTCCLEYVDEHGQPIFTRAEALAMDQRICRVLATRHVIDPYEFFITAEAAQFTQAITATRPLTTEEAQWQQQGNLAMLYDAWQSLTITATRS